jgi:hypothetical protein
MIYSVFHGKKCVGFVTGGEVLSYLRRRKVSRGRLIREDLWGDN